MAKGEPKHWLQSHQRKPGWQRWRWGRHKISCLYYTTLPPGVDHELFVNCWRHHLSPHNTILYRELGSGQEQWFPTSLPKPSTTTSGRPCSTSSTTSAPSQTFSLYQGIKLYGNGLSRKMLPNVNRKAKDTDYLLITEDMKTYGCGCCSIGLGKFKLGDFSLAVLLALTISIPIGLSIGLQTIRDFCLTVFLTLYIVNPCRQVGRFKLGYLRLA